MIRQKNRFKIYWASLLFLTATSLSSCFSPKQIERIQCSFEELNDPFMYPTELVHFTVIATSKSGVQYRPATFSEPGNPDNDINSLGGPVKHHNFENYKFEITGGTLFKHGIHTGNYVGNKEIINSKNTRSYIRIDTADIHQVHRKIKLVAEHVKRPDLKDSFEFYLNYKGTQSWNYNAPEGEDAGELEFVLTKLKDSAFYNQFYYDVYAIKSLQDAKMNTTYAIIAEEKGVLEIFANGGNGRNGAAGEKGEDGRNKALTRENGRGKDGYQGGTGGNGGTGASIRLYVDESARRGVSAIRFFNAGGNGGFGGPGGAGGAGGLMRNDDDGGHFLNGNTGPAGADGQRGQNGPEVEIIYGSYSF